MQVADGLNPVGWAHKKAILSSDGAGFDGVDGARVGWLEILRKEDVR